MAEPVKVLMLKTLDGSPDGRNVNRYLEGQEYMLTARLCEVFESLEGCKRLGASKAKEPKAEKSEKKSEPEKEKKMDAGPPEDKALKPKKSDKAKAKNKK